MSVQPAAELSAIPEFPALSRRAAGEYNDMAYDFGNHMGTPGPFVGEMNALAANVEHNATEAATSTATAGQHATAAAASAATAINAPGTLATSTTSLALSTGTKSLTLAQTGKAFGLGQQIKLSRNAAPTTRMFGAITAFNSGTGAMTVEVTLPVEGAGGPYSDWDIALGTAVTAAPPEQKTRSITTADTAAASDRQKVLVFTGASALTLAFDPVATLTDGWFIKVQNASTFAWTLDPSGSEQIDGAATLVLQPGEVRDVRCTGSALATVKVYADNVLIVRDEKTSGTTGGAGTSGNWVQRTLNTVSVNTIAGASLASNQITLPPGTYDFSGSVPASNLADKNKARLYDVTAGAVAWLGTSSYVNTALTACSYLNGRITLTVASALRVEHRVANGSADSFGLANSFAGVNEVYTEITFRKVG